MFILEESSITELNTTVCAVASAPNFLSDRNSANDMTCGSFLTFLSSDDAQAPGFMKVYPNPSSGHFALGLADGSHAVLDVQVFDLSGKLLSHTPQVPSSQSISTHTLHPGLYVVHASDGNHSFVGKLVVR